MEWKEITLTHYVTLPFHESLHFIVICLSVSSVLLLYGFSGMLPTFQHAADCNACTIPVSLSPSVDGVPFLMHDNTLRRTTDVEKIFPDRQVEDASFFNWTDLRQLSAGQWFLEVEESFVETFFYFSSSDVYVFFFQF